MTGVTDITVGFNRVFVRLGDGSLAWWGQISDEWFGDLTASSLTPITQVAGEGRIEVSWSYDCLVRTSGTLRYFFGHDPNSYYPEPPSGISGVRDLRFGSRQWDRNHQCALMDDETVRCAGIGSYGALGYGTSENREALDAPIPGLTGVKAIAVGYEHTCALLADGTVRCWGRNAAGQLGDGTRETRFSPTPVAGLSGVVSITAGQVHTCALRADSSVACWGANDRGQLGDDSMTERLSPVSPVW